MPLPIEHFRPFCLDCPKGSGCHCGESSDAQFEWEFAAEDTSRSTVVFPEPRTVQFHPSYRLVFLLWSLGLAKEPRL